MVALSLDLITELMYASCLKLLSSFTPRLVVAGVYFKDHFSVYFGVITGLKQHDFRLFFIKM